MGDRRLPRDRAAPGRLPSGLDELVPANTFATAPVWCAWAAAMTGLWSTKLP
ncbi:hypothetical protein [Streptomyces pluripotens]|uniref:hypothetical protein n=1 Tax=Streptomyces pluripotens TaxID=1355015 RepID=UPI000A585769|nr:hypothetical protein [Streptomyces pluripotens]